MKIIIGLTAFIAFSSILGVGAVHDLTPVRPRPVYGVLLSPAETEKYLDMAVKYSRYPKPWIARPVIDLVPLSVWNFQVCLETECGILGYSSEKERDIVHILDTIPADVVTRLGWTRDEIIVHELVHWLQLQAGLKYPDACAVLDADETEAYNAQFQYAARELHKDHGFWKPEIYLGCIEDKMLRGRGHH